MGSKLSALAVRAIGAIVLVSALVNAYTPALARADQAAGQTPAAVQVSFSVQAQSDKSSFAATGSGTVNSNGDLHVTLYATEPAPHTADIISSQGTIYVSADGEPYQSMSLANITGSAPAACAGSLNGGAAGLPAGLNPQSMPLLASLLQPAGTATVNGVVTNHLTGHLDLGVVGPLLGSAVQQTMTACGTPANQFDPSSLQTVLSGGALDLDMYVGQADNFPRRVQASLNLPSTSFQASFAVDLTPLATAAPIAPPQ